MANGKGKHTDGKHGDSKEQDRKRKRDAVRDDARVSSPSGLASDQGQVIVAVAAVALVLGAGLGVLLFGASRKRAAGAGVPGNLALGGDATGDLTVLADDSDTGLATQDETGAPSDDWYAMREGAGGADAVAVPEPSGAGDVAREGASEYGGEHVPTDLAPGAPHPDRAIEAFRPDRDARVRSAERDAFAPATMPVPSRVEAMGNGDDD